MPLGPRNGPSGIFGGILPGAIKLGLSGRSLITSLGPARPAGPNLGGILSAAFIPGGIGIFIPIFGTGGELTGVNPGDMFGCDGLRGGGGLGMTACCDTVL